MKPGIITAIIITNTISTLYANPTTSPSISPSTSPTASPTTIPIASPTATPTFSLDSYPSILEIETSQLTTYYWYEGENHNERRVYRSDTEWYIYYQTGWVNRWTVSNEGILDGGGQTCARDNLYECYKGFIVRYCVNGSESVTDVYTVSPPYTGFYYNGKWRLHGRNLDDKFIYYEDDVWKITDKNLVVTYAICDKDDIFDCNQSDGFEFGACYNEESINLSFPQTTIIMTEIGTATNITYEDARESNGLHVVIGLVIIISSVIGCIIVIGYKYRAWTKTREMTDGQIKISIKMKEMANNTDIDNVQMQVVDATGKINCDQIKPIPINTGINIGEKTLSASIEELYDECEIDNNEQDVGTPTPNVIPGEDTPSCEQPGCQKNHIAEYRNEKDTLKDTENRCDGDV